MPNKFRILNRWLQSGNVKILDVGCGNHSATLLKSFYPNARYFGVDKTKEYVNSPADFQLMEKFFEMDISGDSFSALPDNFFHIIICTHVIEHISNGEDFLQKITPKLTPKGIIYLETPRPATINFPGVPVILNFYSDPSHIRIYPLPELFHILQNLRFQILKKGTHHNLFSILLIPVNVLTTLLILRKIIGGTFWDLLGFTNYVLAQNGGS